MLPRAQVVFADAYNGQQGDMWDAQKDMALAVLGAFAALALKWRRPRSSGERSEG